MRQVLTTICNVRHHTSTQSHKMIQVTCNHRTVKLKTTKTPDTLDFVSDVGFTPITWQKFGHVVIRSTHHVGSSKEVAQLVTMYTHMLFNMFLWAMSTRVCITMHRKVHQERNTAAPRTRTRAFLLIFNTLNPKP